jgi:hypothetical protein
LARIFPTVIKDFPMTLVELIIIFIIAVFVTAAFKFGFKNKGPRGTFWVFFVIIFLAGWVARLWIAPLGPEIMGVAWIPILIVGLIFALILAVTITPPKYPAKEVIDKQVGSTTDEDKSAVTFGAIFWLLLIILAVSVIIGYSVRHLP